MKRIIILSGILILLISSCVDRPKDLSEIAIDFQDKIVQKIYNFQDTRSTDSLIKYLQSDNATYRYLATTAMASVQNEDAIGLLNVRLEDEHPDVRSAAIYSLGQIGSEKAVDALVSAFDTSAVNIDSEQNAMILESIGKCGDKKMLHFIASIGDIRPRDTLRAYGQSVALYRFLTRGMIDSVGTLAIIKRATDSKFERSSRLYAAHYLFRGLRMEKISIPGESRSDIVKAFSQSKDDDFKMALALAVGSTESLDALQILKLNAIDAKDYRVRCNSIMALKYFDYLDVAETVIKALSDGNTHVRQTAADFLYYHGAAVDGRRYWELGKLAANWNLRNRLYAAANKHLPAAYFNTKNVLNGELLRGFDTLDNVYEKAAILETLSAFNWNYRNIYKKGFSDPSLVVKTAAARGIANILNDKDFAVKFGGNKYMARNQMAGYIREAVDSSDIGMIAELMPAIIGMKADAKSVFKDAEFLRAALTKMKLPKDIETYNLTLEAIATIEGTAFKKKTLEHNNPINWNLVGLVVPKTRALIQTEKGAIEFEFYTEQAPGSVANFIALAKKGFYDDKTFHRVVPNFVIQGGCPRGDGYGAEDYSIRSELANLKYDEAGYLGMASAGKDTEGTQWFITHSPTPHLDGKYTIFGKVTKGMDVVHAIDIGTKINKVIVE